VNLTDLMFLWGCWGILRGCLFLTSHFLIFGRSTLFARIVQEAASQGMRVYRLVASGTIDERLYARHVRGTG
jgi:hypothetical protein